MKHRWLLILLIVGAGILAYHNCLFNEMFWDDDDFILKNRFIKDWAFFPEFFKQNLVAGGYFVSNYWRPMLLTVFAWAWHTWHTWLPGWHSLNIFFHTLDAILLYFVLCRLTSNRTLSIIVALIFVTHPVHNEAVVYVNSLGDSLATFFVLSSLLLFIRFRQSHKSAFLSRNFWFSILAFPLAVMSKETGFILCALLPTMDILFFQNNSSLFKRLQKTLLTTWPFLIMAIIYVVLRGTVLNFSNSFNFYNESNAFTSSILIRLFTFFKAVTQYAGFLFFPYELRVERQLPWAQSLLEWDVLFGGALIGLLIFLLFKYWKTRPAISFGCAWFFIAIAPASNVLVPINSVLYEHFLYVPMIGIVLVVCATLLPIITQRNWRKPAFIILAIVLITFCSINIRRNQDWRTAIGFYEQLVKYSPSYRVINNLGMEYADKGIHDKAEFWYLRAIAMDPMNPVAYHNIAGTYRDTSRLHLAEINFKKAIELDQKFIFSYRALAELYYITGNYLQSLNYLSVVAQYDPTDKNVQEFLMMLKTKTHFTTN